MLQRRTFTVLGFATLMMVAVVLIVVASQQQAALSMLFSTDSSSTQSTSYFQRFALHQGSRRRGASDASRHYLEDPLFSRTNLSSVVSLTTSSTSKNSTSPKHSTTTSESCLLADVPDHTPRLDLRNFAALEIEPQHDCAVVTALYGAVEKSIKPVLYGGDNTHLHPDLAESEFPPNSCRGDNCRCVHLLFLGNTALLATVKKDSGWRVIMTPYHLSDPRIPRDGGGSPFQHAKWYKMNAHRILPSTIRFLFWVDGDTQVVDAGGAEEWIKVLEERSSIVTMKHRLSLSAYEELLASEPKYGGKLGTGHFLSSFYLTHLLDGFCEMATTASTRSNSNAHRRPNASELSCVIQSGWRGQCRGGHMRQRLPMSSRFGRNHHYFCDVDVVSADAKDLANKFVAAVEGGEGVGCMRYHSELKSEQDSKRSLLSVPFTKIIGFDLKAKDMAAFLDYWYAITFHHWQDQLSAVIACWRFGVTPSVMPFPKHWMQRVGHGK
ncbi:membrane-associated protein, putative [Bodo saltans]|uniref:Membrane-associated protein, putative n=1 Tax=Bodo saltans TaxID=75058 RepID=A0A0S4J960_BODSA|nr:membrane-associated protein, putative [Bodo saltans]|eukprot:CUG86670.1 membrane-associated protein, putative [Bodo saltans]